MPELLGVEGEVQMDTLERKNDPKKRRVNPLRK